MTDTAPRSLAARIRDTLALLDREVDLWIAGVDADGEPRLALLSFLWTDGGLLVATSTASATGRNLLRARDEAGPGVRLGLGATRDVVLIDAAVEPADPDPGLAAVYATKAGWDPSGIPGYAWFRLVPRSIQAWREEDELAGRWIHRAGAWLADSAG
jgi:hypothetical protein